MSCPAGYGSAVMLDPPRVINPTDLTYNDYLQVPELLSLQHPKSDPPHHDEMLFIIIHQAYELWFKLILHEMECTVERLRNGEILRARHFLNRCGQIMKLLVQQIHIIETMNPVEFLEFRDLLNPASGFQSLQFREVEFLLGLKDRRYKDFFQHRPDYKERLEERAQGPDLRLELYDCLRAKGFPLPLNCRIDHLAESKEDRDQVLSALSQVFMKYDDEKMLPVYLLLESCLEVDKQLSLWREHHIIAIERIIGRRRGTGGSSGVEYLKQTTIKRAFPYLWEVRTVLGKGD